MRARWVPQVEYFSVASPASNYYYIGSPAGEIYGLDHNVERFGAKTLSALRPEVPEVPRLYLSGQSLTYGPVFRRTTLPG